MRITLAPGLLILASCAGCAAEATMAAPPPLPKGGAQVTSGDKDPGAKGASLAATEGKESAAADRADADEKKLDLQADQGGEAFAEGGLGLSGTGKGGGGTGEGTIGLGSIGTLGHGGGTGTGQGYGSGSGRAGGKSSGSRGKVAAATATTTGGGLPADVIQRIVRSNTGTIQFCYEAALMKAPALAGKVSVTFTINAQGAVVSAAAADTNISDAEMVTCVISAVKRMSFPAPEGGGPVVATYPFAFSAEQ